MADMFKKSDGAMSAELRLYKDEPTDSAIERHRKKGWNITKGNSKLTKDKQGNPIFLPA